MSGIKERVLRSIPDKGGCCDKFGWQLAPKRVGIRLVKYKLTQDQELLKAYENSDLDNTWDVNSHKMTHIRYLSGGRHRAVLGHPFLKIRILRFWHLLIQNLILITKMTSISWVQLPKPPKTAYKVSSSNISLPDRIQKFRETLPACLH